MKAKEVAMVVAISVLSAFFVGLLYDAIIPEPDYNVFCNSTAYGPKYYTYPAQGQQCNYNMSIEDQKKIDQCINDGGSADFNYASNGCQEGFKECNYCNKYYQDELKKYSRNLFLVIAPIGFLFVIIGLYIGAEVIGTGFMFSGILLLIYSTIRYFGNMSKLLRVIVIGVELVLLLLISWRKLKK